MLFWPKKSKPKQLFEDSLKGKGLSNGLDVPIAMMVPMVAMMKADGERHANEINLIYSLCENSPIFLNPSRSHVSAWINEAERFMREDCGQSDEVACKQAKSVLKPPLRQTAFAFTIMVLFADEKVRKKEKEKAGQIAQWFEIGDDLAAEIVKVVSILRHGRDGH